MFDHMWAMTGPGPDDQWKLVCYECHITLIETIPADYKGTALFDEAVAEHNRELEEEFLNRQRRLADSMPDLSSITRVTVVGNDDVVFEEYDLYAAGAVLDIQDDGRTLKILPADKFSR